MDSLLTGAVLIALGLILVTIFLLSAWEIAIFLRLMQSGKTVDGEIVDRLVMGRSNGPIFKVVYSFVDGLQGKPYERQQTVQWRRYGELTKGTQVRVKFLPNNPKISRLSDDNVERGGLVALAFGVLIIAGYYWGLTGVFTTFAIWIVIFGLCFLLIPHLA